MALKSMAYKQNGAVTSEASDKSQEYRYFVWCLKDVRSQAEVFQIDK
jgi:hypothetical protein